MISNAKKLVLGLSLLIASQLQSQELDFTVIVSTPNLQIADPQIFNSLQKDITEFINTTKWTDDTFEEFEKIKGNIQFTITKENSTSSFDADITITTTRPIYKSKQETTLISFIDRNMTFSYNQGQPLRISDQAYYDNLSSTLTWIAYMALGYDYDSFEELGGDKYFNKAREIYNNLPSSVKNRSGWKNDNLLERNKFKLMDDILNPRVRTFRLAWYEYHRTALDNMHLDPDKQRAVMVGVMSSLNDVIRSIPNSVVLKMFSDTKRDELVEIFKVGDQNQKNRVRETMSLIDPGNSSIFNQLK